MMTGKTSSVFSMYVDKYVLCTWSSCFKRGTDSELKLWGGGIGRPFMKSTSPTLIPPIVVNTPKTRTVAKEVTLHVPPSPPPPEFKRCM